MKNLGSLLSGLRASADQPITTVKPGAPLQEGYGSSPTASEIIALKPIDLIPQNPSATAEQTGEKVEK
ncbi:MAG: hypothetical protein ACREAA_10675 [Candidatus Polarisedimenticolia bacterium]